MTTVSSRLEAAPEKGRKARTRAAIRAPTPSLTRQRERRRRPASTKASSPSTIRAKAAAAAQPVSTRIQFSVCRPEKIRSPRLGWPTVVASVAAPIVLLTSVAMLRERTSGTLERLLTTPIGKVDILLGYGIAFAIAASVQAAVVSALAYRLLGLDTLGGDNTALIDAVQVVTAPNNDFSFETHTLVGGTVPEARDDLEIAVADQRRDHAAVHRLSVRQESSPALGRRPLMWRQFQEFLRRCAIVEWIDHVGPGRFVEGCDQLRQLLRVLAA